MIMFKRKEKTPRTSPIGPAIERITSVMGDGTAYHGKLSGRGGVRIEGAFDGEIALNGTLVVGTTGRVTCDHLQANIVIVAGAVRGDITADKVEIRSTGRVWGNITTTAFSTEEGAFLRGQVQMEDFVLLDQVEAEGSESPQEELEEGESV